MATGETLMVLGAMVLLSVVLLSMNGALLTNSEVVMEGKIASMAITLAQQYIEDATPRGEAGFETIYADYDGRVDFYRYRMPEGGGVADFVIEELDEEDSTLADYRVSIAVDTTVGDGLSEMTVRVSSPFLEHGVNLGFVFARQY